MAEYVIASKSDMTSIADAIRTKGNTTSALSFPNGMIGAIEALDGGSATPSLQAKTVAPSTSAKTVTPDSGYDGLSQVTVSAIQTETKSVTPSTSAQTVTPTSGKYLSKVTVGAVNTETKSVTPTTSSQNVTPSSGKYLSKVTVGAIETEAITITTTGTYTPSSGKYFSEVTAELSSDIVNIPYYQVTISSAAQSSSYTAPDLTVYNTRGIEITIDSGGTKTVSITQGGIFVIEWGGGAQGGLITSGSITLNTSVEVSVTDGTCIAKLDNGAIIKPASSNCSVTCTRGLGASI